MKKIITLVLLATLILMCFVGCGDNEKIENDGHSYKSESEVEVLSGSYDTSKTGAADMINMDKVNSEINAYQYEDFATTKDVTDFVVIRVKGYGDIVLALRGDVAPTSVENFKKLVKDGFYSGLVFHRVMSGFMIQGGGMDKDLNDKESDEIKGEFWINGFENNLRHIRGVLSMARTTVPDSASSQFFIMHKDTASLDGSYAAFGYVLVGMNVVDKIAETETETVYKQGYPMENVPVNDIVIEKAFFVKPIKK